MTEKLRPIAPGESGFMRNVNSLFSASGYGFDPSPLANQPLAGVEVSEDKVRLIFRLADGRTLTYRTEGDCCSSSWIEHLTVPPDIAGATVTAYGEREMGETTDGEWGETIRVYQTSFVTAKGEIVLEYRNSSNGYYGGYLSGPSEGDAS